MDTKRICLWSGPRNVSTALMYAFAQRSDTQVIDEPLYAHYLQTKYGTEARDSTHPGAKEVMASMSTDSEQVIREVILGPCEKPVLFMKQMAHHLIDIDLRFLARTLNVFLIRDPREMLLSLTKVIGTPTLADTGFKTQHDLLIALRDVGQSPPVLDARLLLEDPASVLAQLCERLGLRFEDSMLSWEAGGNPADGVWAPYWYQNVHRSTGFAPYRPKSEPFPAELEAVFGKCSRYYEVLRQEAICPLPV
ncbi:MAG: sulfotransferase family protein [Candidatus Poribacteria bacterium]|nr:sulfotransferase family protein [Candidatus Poribacteria bacterium]